MNVHKHWMLRLKVMLVAIGPLIWLSLIASTHLLASDDLPKGFQRISGKYVDIITDLPIDDAMRELPVVFDAAVPQWCDHFHVAPKDVRDWHVEAFVMGVKQRFQDAGMIPKEVPDFPYGFQYGNQVWLLEQPSHYYRRHLLLHEGTHWFMNRKYSDHGPPWLMEGMAEWFGTHRWGGQKLVMGFIPQSRDEVPYWGRIALIQQQLAAGVAPTLEDILRYDKRAHQQVDAYAWSWAAVLFLQHHPSTAKHFDALLKLKKMKSDTSMSKLLLSRLNTQLPTVRQEWNAMLTELEYGFDPRRGWMVIDPKVAAVTEQAVEVAVQTDRTWQSAGIRVNAGDTIEVQASGQYAVGEVPKPWTCTPAGVTLEYYRGRPLGKLLLHIATDVTPEPKFSELIETHAVGESLQLKCQSTGEVQLRINESNLGLSDNTGQLKVTIRKK